MGEQLLLRSHGTHKLHKAIAGADMNRGQSTCALEARVSAVVMSFISSAGPRFCAVTIACHSLVLQATMPHYPGWSRFSAGMVVCQGTSRTISRLEHITI